MSVSSCSDSELIQVISELSAIKKMKVIDIGTSVSVGTDIGTGAASGGLLFGPPGILMGAVVTGIISGLSVRKKRHSVPDILRNDLNEKQHCQLANSIRHLLSAENIETLNDLDSQLKIKDNSKITLLIIIKKFLKDEFNYIP